MKKDACKDFLELGVCEPPRLKKVTFLGNSCRFHEAVPIEVRSPLPHLTYNAERCLFVELKPDWCSVHCTVYNRVDASGEQCIFPVILENLCRSSRKLSVRC